MSETIENFDITHEIANRGSQFLSVLLQQDADIISHILWCHHLFSCNATLLSHRAIPPFCEKCWYIQQSFALCGNLLQYLTELHSLSETLHNWPELCPLPTFVVHSHSKGAARGGLKGFKTLP